MEREVSLNEMLKAREVRAAHQMSLLKEFKATLICFTMNIAGPIKNSELIKRGYEKGKKMLEKDLQSHQITILHFEESCTYTGNEGFYVVDADRETVQRITSEIEDASELGRLFDMDVLGSKGEKCGRAELGLPERRCLICGGPAKDCARSRRHSVAELQVKTLEILKDALKDDKS